MLFFLQLQERDKEIFGKCDLELVALSSKRNYRKLPVYYKSRS